MALQDPPDGGGGMLVASVGFGLLEVPLEALAPAVTATNGLHPDE